MKIHGHAHLVQLVHIMNPMFYGCSAQCLVACRPSSTERDRGRSPLQRQTPTPLRNLARQRTASPAPASPAPALPASGGAHAARAHRQLSAAPGPSCSFERSARLECVREDVCRRSESLEPVLAVRTDQPTEMRSAYMRTAPPAERNPPQAAGTDATFAAAGSADMHSSRLHVWAERAVNLCVARAAASAFEGLVQELPGAVRSSTALSADKQLELLLDTVLKTAADTESDGLVCLLAQTATVIHADRALRDACKGSESRIDVLSSCLEVASKQAVSKVVNIEDTVVRALRLNLAAEAVYGCAGWLEGCLQAWWPHASSQPVQVELCACDHWAPERICCLAEGWA